MRPAGWVVRTDLTLDPESPVCCSRHISWLRDCSRERADSPAVARRWRSSAGCHRQAPRTAGRDWLFHSLGHSCLSVVVMIPVARPGRAGLAVAMGWAPHLTLDAIHVIVNGRPADALFLFWPIVTPPDPLTLPPGSFFVYYVGTVSFYVERLIWGGLTVVLVRAGVRTRQASIR